MQIHFTITNQKVVHICIPQSYSHLQRIMLLAQSDSLNSHLPAKVVLFLPTRYRYDPLNPGGS